MNDWPKVLENSRNLLHQHFAIDHVTLQPETVPQAVVHWHLDQ